MCPHLQSWPTSWVARSVTCVRGPALTASSLWVLDLPTQPTSPVTLLHNRSACTFRLIGNDMCFLAHLLMCTFSYDLSIGQLAFGWTGLMSASMQTRRCRHCPVTSVQVFLADCISWGQPCLPVSGQATVCNLRVVSPYFLCLCWVWDMRRMLNVYWPVTVFVLSWPCKVGRTFNPIINWLSG